MVGLIERYRDRLPFEPTDPVVSLQEGSTPLVLAERVSERVGAEVWLKLEGANPTGSFKDRGMTCAVSAAVREGAQAVICASTGNTAASAAAYAARAGLTGAVIVPEGKIATGKLAQALMHGARVVALRGNFDEALALVRELARRHPIALVNSVNPFRLEGQKTAAFELVDELGRELDALCIPVGNAGNITAYWKGFEEAGASPRMLGWQAEGAAPLVHGAPVEHPETVASAIRIGNPARWEEAMGAMAASHGRDPGGQRRRDPRRVPLPRRARGRVLRAGLGRGRGRAAQARGRGRRAGRVRADRARAEGPADRARQRRLGRAVRAGARRRRARRAGVSEAVTRPRAEARRRLVRVPASSANLGPGFDVLACALGLHVELEVVETGTFGVVTDLPIATDRRNLAVRAFGTLAPVDGIEFRIRSDVPLSGGLGTSAAAIVAGLVAADSLYELDADVLGHAIALEGHPDNVAAALLGGFVLCADGRAERFDVPAGLEAVVVVPEEPVRTAAARAALPPEVPMADAIFNVAHAGLLLLGLQRGDWDLVARGLADRLHQPRREHLYPRSMALVRRAPELGALGATISGAGPTVLVWCAYEATGAVVERLTAECAGWAAVRHVAFEPRGADVVSL